MKNQHKTKAFIQRRVDINGSVKDLNISLPATIGLRENPFLLIIQSTSKECTRLTIYPISRQKIIRLSLYGSNISEEVINRLSKILKKYEIIHNSGFLVKQKQFYYECYFNLSLSDVKSKDLKTSLDKIKNIFKEIKIEEVSLNN